jgi:hypothetical protein
MTVLDASAKATALATAALGAAGPDRAMVTALLAELTDEERAEVVTLALVSAAAGGWVRRGIALDVAMSRTTR